MKQANKPYVVTLRFTVTMRAKSKEWALSHADRVVHDLPPYVVLTVTRPTAVQYVGKAGKLVCETFNE